MTPAELKQRTKKFAVDIIAFSATLPRDLTVDVINRQLVKSGTGVGANYRGSCRAKSRADFVVKLTTAEEEGDEADQLVRIFVSSINTARGHARQG